MEIIALAATSRKETGSGSAKRARREGKIPATLYGHGMEPVSLQVSSREFIHLLHSKAGENAVVDLSIGGIKLKESTCLIKDLQHHPVTDDIIHVDFTVVSMTENIDVFVPLVTLNSEDSIGLKENGVLDVVHHEIEVSCLPTQIPEKIEVDIKSMNIGDAIHAKELVLPEGVACNLDDEEVVVTIHPPAKEEEKPEEEGEEAAQPEVIEKGKKTEEEGEGAPAAAPKEGKSE